MKNSEKLVGFFNRISNPQKAGDKVMRLIPRELVDENGNINFNHLRMIDVNTGLVLSEQRFPNIQLGNGDTLEITWKLVNEEF